MGWIVLILLLFIIITFSGVMIIRRTKNSSINTKFVQSFALGTVIQITAYGKNSEISVSEAIDRLGYIDDKMSYYKGNSDISIINQNAGLSFQNVSEETYYVIKKALNYSRLSDGALDLTVRPLTDLWGIGGKNANIPEGDAIRDALRLVNYNDIEFIDESKSIKLKKKNQSVDVNCIAKGYAADEVKRILQIYNVKSAIIDLGGNVYALGSKIDGSMWRVGIQHPLKSRGNYVGFLNIKDRSVVTSGDYEKFFVINNERYHHIIDTKTGYPVKNKIISTTIISRYSIDGDALTTCLYIMGVEKGLEFVKGFKDIDAIIITEDKKIYTTENIKKNFNIVDNEFICE